MVRKLIFIALYLFFCCYSFSQDVAKINGTLQLSANSQAAAQDNSDVNMFTGSTSVNMPLYQYSGNGGLHLSVSAIYAGGGGIRLSDEPTFLGTGWMLNTGGVITRSVRGKPDDWYGNGFISSSAPPTDIRSSANKYYYDTLDAEQDIFQFNFEGGSGKFYIGRNGGIEISHSSNLIISYNTISGFISSFTIKTPDGTRYTFSDAESSSIQEAKFILMDPHDTYSDMWYNSAWYLSKIIAPFSTDSIRFYYSVDTVKSSPESPSTTAAYAWVIPSANPLKSADSFFNSTQNWTATKTLDSVLFPGIQKLIFTYKQKHRPYDSKFLTQFTINDSIFRSGYRFIYDNVLLQNIIPFTQKEDAKGYGFAYNSVDSFNSTNGYDYWGFRNNSDNIPSQDPHHVLPYVQGIYNSGSDRKPNLSALGNTLAYMYLPSGGYVHYEYELNNRRSLVKTNNDISITGTTGSSANTIQLKQALNTQHQLVLSIDDALSRVGSPPLSGTCNLICNIKSTDGSILYQTKTFSLYNLFYNSLAIWTFNIPNGSYLLQTSLSGGGSITSNFPFHVSWENKDFASGTSVDTVGGLRIKRITKGNFLNSSKRDSVVREYQYLLPDGNSSGFLGDIPKYYYPLRKRSVLNGVDSIYNYLTNDPIGNLNSVQGSPVGYSRVTVFNGTASDNLGKTVYEFTDLKDVNSNYYTAAFPYAPQDLKEWGLGLPEKISVYDSSGNLVKRSVNSYTFDDNTDSSSNFQSLKLEVKIRTYQGSGAPQNRAEHSANTYFVQPYYPSCGWASLSSRNDTTYYDDGSIQTSSASYTYDSHYNITKVTTDYDKSRGLKLETRLYRPYDYTVSSGSLKTLKDSNVISPVISTEKWIIGDANPRIVDATITNYQTLTTKHIVPVSTYKFQSNTPISQSIIGTFNPSTINRNLTYFVQQAAYSLFDNVGNDVQITNSITGQNSSVVYDYNKQYVIAKVSNAAYSDLGYTSFESDGTTWAVAGSLRNTATAMTGKKSYALSNGNVTRTGLNAALTYVVTFWYKMSSGSVFINGNPATNISVHGVWGLFSITITGVTSATISGTGIIDELRLIPRDANMITYTYEPNIGITSTCDANNTIVYTEYDNLNRIKVIRDIDRNIIKKYSYSDTTFTNTWMTPAWVATYKECTKGSQNYGKYDSVYVDMNINSDSYRDTMHITKGTDSCMCTTDPVYRVTNGVCEKAQLVIVGAVQIYVKPVGHPEQNHWEWQCTFYYKWSDGYRTSNQQTQSIDGSPCVVGS